MCFFSFSILLLLPLHMKVGKHSLAANRVLPHFSACPPIWRRDRMDRVGQEEVEEMTWKTSSLWALVFPSLQEKSLAKAIGNLI